MIYLDYHSILRKVFWNLSIDWFSNNNSEKQDQDIIMKETIIDKSKWKFYTIKKYANFEILNINFFFLITWCNQI